MAECYRFQQLPQTYYNPHHPLTHLPLQSSQIDHLRRQNDFLRKQLQTLMHMHQTTNKTLYPRVPHTMCSPLPNNSNSDDADEIYRNKLSKIKMRKSPRHSMEMNATSPNSPCKIGGFAKSRQRDNFADIHSKKGEMPNRNGKMLAVVGEKRYKQIEQNISPRATTPRKHQIYEQTYLTQLNKVVESSQFNENHTLRPPKPSHQRAGSSYHPPIDHNLLTKRVANNTQPPSKRFFPTAAENSLHYPSQYQQKIGSCSRYPPSPLIQRQNQNSINSSGSKKAILEAEHPKAVHKGVYSKRGTEVSSQGDSCLSIERNLCQSKQNRKLRCEIYLLEDPQL